jgi:hypothetical protein
MRFSLPCPAAASRLFWSTTVVAASIALWSASARAQTTTINFDVNSNGIPIAAPSLFAETTRLTTLYSPLGVTFSGPGGNNGGAILDEGGNFGVNARSGRNFLAFNRVVAMSDGGFATDPETITFAVPEQTVSIYAAGGNTTDTFVMNAFDATNSLVGTSTVSSQQFALVSTTAGGGITHVVLTQTGDSIFVYDDLSFTAMPNSQPEPAGVSVLGIGAAMALVRRRRAR